MPEAPGTVRAATPLSLERRLGDSQVTTHLDHQVDIVGKLGVEIPSWCHLNRITVRDDLEVVPYRNFQFGHLPGERRSRETKVVDHHGGPIKSVGDSATRGNANFLTNVYFWSSLERNRRQRKVSGPNC